MKKACRDGGFQSQACLGHALHNLVMVDGFRMVPELHTLLMKCRNIIRILCYRSEELLRVSAEENRKALMEMSLLQISV